MLPRWDVQEVAIGLHKHRCWVGQVIALPNGFLLCVSHTCVHVCMDICIHMCMDLQHAPTHPPHTCTCTACALRLWCDATCITKCQRHDDYSRSLAIFDKITSEFAWHCGLLGLSLSCTDMPYLRARSLRWSSPSSFACGLM